MNDWKYSKGKAREHIRSFIADESSRVLLAETLTVDLLLANPALGCAEAYEQGKACTDYVIKEGAQRSRIDIDRGRKVYAGTVSLALSESAVTQLRAQIHVPTGDVYLAPVMGSDLERDEAWKRLRKFRGKALVAEARERSAAGTIQG